MKKKDAKVRATMVPIAGTFVPGGSGMIALKFEIAKGWHMYWDGRNDTGAPPTAEFAAPEGYSVGAPDTWRWPAPERHVAPGDLLDHVYYERLAILVPVQVPTTAKPGDRVTLRASAEWLVCDESCIAENGELTAIVTIADKAAQTSESDRLLVKEVESRMPVALGRDVRVTRTGDAVTISHPEATSITFMPSRTCAEISDLVTTGSVKGSRLVLPIVSKDENKDELSGMLEIRRMGKPPAIYSVRRAIGSIDSVTDVKKSGPRSAP